MRSALQLVGWVSRLLAVTLVSAITLAGAAAEPPAAPSARRLHHHFERDRIVVGLPFPARVRGLLESTPHGVDGFTRRIVQEAADAVGLRVEFKEFAADDDTPAALLNGEVDAVAPMSIIEERLRKFAFTSQLLVAQGAVYTKRGSGYPVSIEDLRKGRVAVAGGGVAHHWCLERNVPFMEMDTLREALLAVAKGDARYAITTQIAGRVEINLRKLNDQLDEHTLNDDRLNVRFAIATLPRNTTLAADLDSGLAILQDNGRFNALYDQWVGPLQARAAEPAFTRNETMWIVAAVGFAGILGIGAYAVAQRRLAHRTAALRASEARFRVLFDESPDGVMIVDPVTMKPLEVNAAMAQLLGRSPEELQVMGVDQWCAEWDDPKHREDVERTIASGTGDYDSKVRRSDGAVLDVRCRFRPITFGGRTLMQGIFRDITAAKRARESGERERRLFLSGPVVAFRWRSGPGWPVEYVSENVSQFGYSAEALVSGKIPYTSIVHSEDLPRIAAKVRSSLAAGDSHFFQEYRIRSADGRWIWLADYTTIVRDAAGGASHFEGYVIDTTPQRAAADAIRESEARYRAIVENIPALVFSYFVGPSGVPELRLVNSREAEWREVFPCLHVGEDYRVSMRAHIHPDDVDAYDAEVERARRARDRFEIEFRLMSSGGEYRSLHSKCIALPVGGGVVWQSMLVDITELRRASEAARVSEERYREIFNRSYDAIVVFRPEDELILDANERALELYGYSRDEFVGKSFSMVSFDQDRSRAAIERTVSTGVYSDSRWAQRARDGSIIHADVSSSTIEYKGTRAILSFNRDVTAKLQTEGALLASEQRYRSFVQHSSEGVWCIEFPISTPVTLAVDEQVRLFYEHGVMTECNDAMARMYGLERAEQLVGWRLGEILPQADAHNVEYLRAIIEGGYRIDDAESHEVDVHGTPRYFLNSVVCVVEDGCVVRAWGIQRDITAKKLADAALAEARERLGVAVQSADLGVWTMDLRTQLIECDARYLGFLGLEATPGPVEWSRLRERICAEDLPRAEQALRDASSGDGVYRSEYRVQIPGGPVRWISSRGALRRDETGAPWFIAGASMDITEPKLAAEERERLAEQLRQAQKLESLGVMAGGIAHDFNNLLVAIMGNAALALKNLPADTEVHRSISRIEQAAARASDLTRQLLTYAGRDQAEPEPIELSAVVREMVDLVEVSIDRSASVVVELSPGLPLIHADPTQARQVVMNLLSNASEALEGKAGHIRVRTFAADLDEAALARLHTQGCAAAGRFVCIEVSDTGCGMDPAVCARIFEPFFTTKFTGRGLGLTAVLGIVRRHGGAIGIDSTVGKGTVFRVYFPASTVKAAAEALPAPKPRAESEARSGTILIIDDEAMVRDVARMCLEGAGFRVLAMPDGPQAITLARDASAQFDGILLDMTMPNMSGPEVFAHLRKIRGIVPVLLTSGYAEENAAEQLLAEPKVRFIQKPYRPVQLIQAIQDLIAT